MEPTRFDGEDAIFRNLQYSLRDLELVIACLFTGPGPLEYATPMLREPPPDVGMLLSQDFASQWKRAIAANPAIHDGAVIANRRTLHDGYSIAGWSYRLFPPIAECHSEPNRGSAHNSCMAMSQLGGIDAMYLVHQKASLRFSRGSVTTL